MHDLPSLDSASQGATFGKPVCKDSCFGRRAATARSSAVRLGLTGALAAPCRSDQTGPDRTGSRAETGVGDRTP